MSFYIRKGTAADIASLKKADAFVRTGSPNYPDGSVLLFENDPTVATSPHMIQVAYRSPNEPELFSFYERILSVAKNNGIRSIVFPPLGSDCGNFPVKDIWRIAKTALIEESSDIDIYLALDSDIQSRIHHDVYSLNRIVSPYLVEMRQNTIPPGAFGMMFVTSQMRELNSALESAIDSGKKITELFQKHLQGRTISNIAAAVAGVMQKSTCYNILSYEQGGSKKNLIAIGLELHLSLSDFTEIFDAAGLQFTNSKEDIICKYAFRYGWSLYDVDELLADRNLKTLSE